MSSGGRAFHHAVSRSRPKQRLNARASWRSCRPIMSGPTRPGSGARNLALGVLSPAGAVPQTIDQCRDAGVVSHQPRRHPAAATQNRDGRNSYAASRRRRSAALAAIIARARRSISKMDAADKDKKIATPLLVLWGYKRRSADGTSIQRSGGNSPAIWKPSSRLPPDTTYKRKCPSSVSIVSSNFSQRK